MISFVVTAGSRWRRSGAVRFHTISLPQKLARAFSWPGWRRLRYLPPGHRDDMATKTAVALNSNFKLLLLSRILVAVAKSVASCYNRDQTWLCVYWWCQAPPGVFSQPRAITRAFDTNNTHTIMFDTKNTHTIMFDPLTKEWYLSVIYPQSNINVYHYWRHPDKDSQGTTNTDHSCSWPLNVICSVVTRRHGKYLTLHWQFDSMQKNNGCPLEQSLLCTVTCIGEHSDHST